MREKILVLDASVVIKWFSNEEDSEKAIDIKEAVESLYELEIDIIVPTQDVITKAIELAIEHDITVYDATYVSLAELLGAKLVTSDEKLIKACGQLKSVVSLGTLEI